MKLDIKKINLQALIRKPSTAKEAAERSNSFKLLSFVCLIAAIVVYVFGGIVDLQFLETLGMFLIVADVFLFIGWYFASGEAKRMQNINCACGEKYRFPDDVKYEILEEQLSSGKNADNDNITRHVNTKVAFCCTCAKCGKEHTFTTSFVTKKEELNPRGVLLREKEYPLENQLPGFFEV